MTKKEIEEPCPLQHGDRVSHSKFGFGTVLGQPSVYCGALMEPPWVQEQGWIISIKWDSTAEVVKISYSSTAECRKHIEKVVDRTARGLHLWKHEWQQMLDRVEAQRAQTAEALASSFRADPGTATTLARQLAELRSAEDDLIAFLINQESGAHI